MNETSKICEILYICEYGTGLGLQIFHILVQFNVLVKNLKKIFYFTISTLHKHKNNLNLPIL